MENTTNANSNPIESTDVIYATLLQRGVALLSLRLDGVTSMQQLRQSVMSRVERLTGMAMLSVRNSSQGWSSSQSLYLR